MSGPPVFCLFCPTLVGCSSTGASVAANGLPSSPGSCTVLARQALDLGKEAAASARQPEGLPGRCEPHDTLLERILVVLPVEVSLLELEVHVVPVCLLRDLPHPEPPPLGIGERIERIHVLGV